VSVREGRDDGQTFTPSSGAGAGWTGVVIVVIALVAVVLDDRTLGGARIAVVAAIFGLLVWCYMLRPRVVIGSSELELRNPFTSWHVPLAAIRKVAVRAVTLVYTDDRRFDGVAVGRPVRTLVRGRTVPQRSLGVPGFGANRISEGADASRQPKGQLDPNTYADFLTEQVLAHAERARESAPESEPGAARRSWAWPELAGLAVLTITLVVILFV
jgi:hypothetical protein